MAIADQWMKWVRRLEWPGGVLQRGGKGPLVACAQEWLSLAGFGLKVDGDFGPATEAAVREYEAAQGRLVTGRVDEALLQRLEQPARRAIARIEPDGRSLGALVAAYAEQQLAEHPREVGGENRGPWVRLYMGGRQGADWRWCAGFVCFCLALARETLAESDPPLAPSFSCDSLAASAREHGLFLSESDAAAERSQLRRGDFFLVRRSPRDWVHVGIVRGAGEAFMRTIEGNTNDDGVPDGYEVAARTRGYAGMDFITFSRREPVT